jgi:hypothetical protein
MNIIGALDHTLTELLIHMTTSRRSAVHWGYDLVEFYVSEPLQFKPAGLLVCRRCGVEDRPVLGPGSGQHTASALCRHCGCHLKWLSTKSPEQREAQREKARKYGPASPAQLAFLKALGFTGNPPQSVEEASVLIEQLKAAQFARGQRYWPGRNSRGIDSLIG